MERLRCRRLEKLFQLSNAPVRHHAETSDRLANHGPEDRRHAPKEPESSGAEPVFLVTAEELIASIARQAHGDRLASQLRHEKRRDLRWVGKGLIVDAGQQRNDVEGLFGGQAQLGMVGVQVLGDPSRVDGLVVARLGEPDGERLHGRRRLRLHQRGDQR